MTTCGLQLNRSLLKPKLYVLGHSPYPQRKLWIGSMLACIRLATSSVVRRRRTWLGSRSPDALRVSFSSPFHHQGARMQSPRMQSRRRCGPLRDTHEPIAADFRAQAKLFVAFERTSLSLHRLREAIAHRARYFRPNRGSNCTTMWPPPGSLASRLETQKARDLMQCHGKGHSFIGPSLRWLRRSLGT